MAWESGECRRYGGSEKGEWKRKKEKGPLK